MSDKPPYTKRTFGEGSSPRERVAELRDRLREVEDGYVAELAFPHRTAQRLAMDLSILLGETN